MPLTILFAAGDDRWPLYATPLRAALAENGIEAELTQNCPADQADYIIFAPKGGIEDFTPYTRCRGVMGLWAGVEHIVGNTTLTQPLTRMVDKGLERGMVEWVTGHTLRHHIGMDAHILGQDGVWRAGVLPPLAQDAPVTILGLGALGTACAEALQQLGFPVTGWSRSLKDLPGMRCLAGPDGLKEALTGAHTLILLTPLTAETENLLTAERIALMAPGSVVINPGRGPLIDDAALIAALDSGHLRHATLDVFRTEPLPPEHPFWAHPKVTVTPHIASETRPAWSAQIIADNIRRDQAGQTMRFLVDRSVGY